MRVTSLQKVCQRVFEICTLLRWLNGSWWSRFFLNLSWSRGKVLLYKRFLNLLCRLERRWWDYGFGCFCFLIVITISKQLLYVGFLASRGYRFQLSRLDFLFNLSRKLVKGAWLFKLLWSLLNDSRCGNNLWLIIPKNRVLQLLWLWFSCNNYSIYLFSSSNRNIFLFLEWVYKFLWRLNWCFLDWKLCFLWLRFEYIAYHQFLRYLIIDHDWCPLLLWLVKLKNILIFLLLRCCGRSNYRLWLWLDYDWNFFLFNLRFVAHYFSIWWFSESTWGLQGFWNLNWNFGWLGLLGWRCDLLLCSCSRLLNPRRIVGRLWGYRSYRLKPLCKKIKGLPLAGIWDAVDFYSKIDLRFDTEEAGG